MIFKCPDDLGRLLAGTRLRLPAELAKTLGLQRKYQCLFELEHTKHGLFALLAELDIDLYARAPR